MKKILLLVIFLVMSSCAFGKENTTNQLESAKKEIEQVLIHWHKAAATANFDDYFGAMTDDAVFIGTDATENWNKAEFEAYSKPYFDKGKAWSFYAIERNIYLDSSGEVAWFDEVLETQMKLCRGSGVLKKVDGQWKIAHYVLSMTIPNDDADKVIKLKTPKEIEQAKQIINK